MSIMNHEANVAGARPDGPDILASIIPRTVQELDLTGSAGIIRIRRPLVRNGRNRSRGSAADGTAKQ